MKERGGGCLTDGKGVHGVGSAVAVRKRCECESLNVMHTAVKRARNTPELGDAEDRRSATKGQLGCAE